MSEELFELICDECSKPFESNDSNAEICPDCWEKLLGKELETEGKGLEEEKGE